MTPDEALVIVSDQLADFESFIETIEPEFWSDPEEFPEDCDPETGRFGTETLNKLTEALEVLRETIKKQA